MLKITDFHRKSLIFIEKLVKSRSHDFGPGFLGSARHGAAGSWPVGHPGVGEGSAERPGASIITFHRRSPEKTRFECHRMPKRCRVPRDNILAALEEEELVADTQPELVSTNPADDLEVRASKRRKTADHYRSYLCFKTDRERARETSSLTVMRGCCQLSRHIQK